MMASKRGSWVPSAIVVLIILGITGCAGAVQKNATPQPGPTGSVAAFLTDASAPGVVSFTLQVSGATVTDATGKNLSILGTGEQTEFRHLELAPTILAQTPSIPTGSYSSLGLTLANPEISISDSAGNVTQLNGSTTPAVKLANSAVSLPVSLSISTNGVTGVQLDFDIGKSLSVDSTGNYIINPVVNATSVSGTPELNMVDTVGTVGTVSTSNNSFTLQLQIGGDSVPVDVDGNTIWSSDIGQLSNLQSGKTVELNAELQSSGSYLAKFVGSSTATQSTTYEGVLTQLQGSSGSYSVDVVVQ